MVARHFEEIERDPVVLQKRMGLKVEYDLNELTVKAHKSLLINSVLLTIVGIVMSFALVKVYRSITVTQELSLITYILYTIIGFTGIVSMVVGMERNLKWRNFKLTVTKETIVKIVLHDMKVDVLEIGISNPSFEVYHHDHEFHLRVNQGDDHLVLISVKDAIFHSEHGLIAVKEDIERFLAS